MKSYLKLDHSQMMTFIELHWNDKFGDKFDCFIHDRCSNSTFQPFFQLSWHFTCTTLHMFGTFKIPWRNFYNHSTVWGYLVITLQATPLNEILRKKPIHVMIKQQTNNVNLYERHQASAYTFASHLPITPSSLNSQQSSGKISEPRVVCL